MCGGVGSTKGIVGMAVRMACSCRVGDCSFGDGAGRGRWAFTGSESLDPQGASLWEWVPLAVIGLAFDVHIESYLGMGLDMGVINIPSIPRTGTATVSLSLFSGARWT